MRIEIVLVDVGTPVYGNLVTIDTHLSGGGFH